MPKDVTPARATGESGGPSTAAPVAYSADELVLKDQFQDGLALSAQELLETRATLPREVRYVADLRRWLLSQATIALHFEHLLDPESPPVSSTRLMQLLRGSRIACRNTVGTFLSEMHRYEFIVSIDGRDRRRREYRATEKSEALISHYFDIHLRSLDAIDGGNRHSIVLRNPGLLFHAQPGFAKRLCENPEWHHPAQSIARFVRSDSGSSVLHDLVSRAPGIKTPSDSPIWIGELSPSAFSRLYRISKMHVARLFGEARAAGFMGWTARRNRGDCWISPALVHDYRYWQALKLGAASQAFHDAWQKTRGTSSTAEFAEVPLAV